ncbi:MAG: prohibitin family protein [Candidatus Woesearchaeota archaeon]|jgi:prohibitin 1|nr:prohibitin family protein [Candidatus Woesearchaeota archaeon]
MKNLSKIIQNIFKSGMILVIMLVIVIAFLGVNVISDGFVGVKKTLGNFEDDELGTGVHILIPLLSTIETVDIRKTTISESVEVPSKEGLIINLELSVIYRIKADRASDIVQTVRGDIKDTLLIPYMRNGIRDIASGYEASAFYSQDTREIIGNKLQDKLIEVLDEDLIIEDVLLRKVSLPDRVTQAIEDKLDAEQKSQKKEFELVSAKKDAEIEVARAKGVAEANKIIAESISEGYLQYRFIEGLNDGNTEVIYVPTEANLPILEARDK